MTEPAHTEPRLTSPSFPEGHPNYARPQTAQDRDDVLARLEASQREILERRSRAERAAVSPEAKAIKEIVDADGNVPWPEFVKHCGGILEVVAMVDDQGRPDTDQIIPKVDELFDYLFPPQEFKGGMTMTRKPQNRPYVPRRVQAPVFPGDGEISQAEAERLLEEAQKPAPRLTAPR
jgi:hypothetical protein